MRGDGPRLRLVGNLPYNVSTPLLFHFVAHLDAIEDMHFMLQREVVTRMAARPGGKDYGRLTVMLAPLVEVEPLFDIGTGAFSPPPQVVSTFFALKPLRQPPFALRDRAAYARVVAAAFSQRRKTLRNSLGGLLAGRGDRGRRRRPRRPGRDAPARAIRGARGAHCGPRLATIGVRRAEPYNLAVRHIHASRSGPCANTRRFCCAWT